jgi:hypothetical protein
MTLTREVGGERCWIGIDARLRDLWRAPRLRETGRQRVSGVRRAEEEPAKAAVRQAGGTPPARAPLAVCTRRAGFAAAPAVVAIGRHVEALTATYRVARVSRTFALPLGAGLRRLARGLASPTSCHVAREIDTSTGAKRLRWRASRCTDATLALVVGSTRMAASAAVLARGPDVGANAATHAILRRALARTGRARLGRRAALVAGAAVERVGLQICAETPTVRLLTGAARARAGAVDAVVPGWALRTAGPAVGRVAGNVRAEGTAHYGRRRAGLAAALRRGDLPAGDGHEDCGER